MFQGSIPPHLRSIVSEQCRSWHCSDVHVACSGNLTIERVLATHGRFEITGNDVTIYSSALGRFFAGRGMVLKVREQHEEDWGWLNPYMDTPEGTLAVLMIATRMMEGFPATNAYYERMRHAYRLQWERIFKSTVDRLKSATLVLKDFHEGDAVDWMATVPQDSAVISFPPFFTGGYEKMWETLAEVFDWDPPEYDEMDMDRRDLLISRMMEKKHWMFGTADRQHHLDREHLHGITQTTNRGVTIYVYAKEGNRRIVSPGQATVPVMIPRLGQEEEIGDEIALVTLSDPEFRTLRSEYMNAHIKPAGASVALGVVVNGKLVGVFAGSLRPSHAQWDNYLPGPTPTCSATSRWRLRCTRGFQSSSSMQRRRSRPSCCSSGTRTAGSGASSRPRSRTTRCP